MDFEEFIKAGDFIPYHRDGEYIEYLWTDFDECGELIKNNKGIYIYTVVNEGMSMWVLDGIWRVNRMGYLFSKKYVKIREDIEYL